MDLNRLQEFVTVANCKSIKQAAESMGLSPATLSARISNFETSLGSTLLKKTKNGLELTEAGKRFYRDAEEIVQDYQRLRRDLSSFQETNYESIRIAVAGTGLPFYLGPYLDLVNERQPNIRLDIVDDSYCTIREGLSQGKVDLYFAPVMSHVTYEGIRRYPINVSHQYAVLPAKHHLAKQSSISLRDLNHEQIILYPVSGESCIRDFQLANLNAAGISYTVYETDSSAIFYKLLVPIGKGILLTPINAMNPPPNSVTLPVSDIIYPAPSSLFVSKENIKPDVKHFVDDFLNYVKEISTHEHRKTV